MSHPLKAFRVLAFFCLCLFFFFDALVADQFINGYNMDVDCAGTTSKTCLDCFTSATCIPTRSVSHCDFGCRPAFGDCGTTMLTQCQICKAEVLGNNVTITASKQAYIVGIFDGPVPWLVSVGITNTNTNLFSTTGSKLEVRIYNSNTMAPLYFNSLPISTFVVKIFQVYFDNIGKILYIALDNSLGSPLVMHVPFNVASSPPSIVLTISNMVSLTPVDSTTAQTLSCGVMHSSGLYLFISRAAIPSGSKNLFVARMDSISLTPAVLDFGPAFTLSVTSCAASAGSIYGVTNQITALSQRLVAVTVDPTGLLDTFRSFTIKIQTSTGGVSAMAVNAPFSTFVFGTLSGRISHLSIPTADAASGVSLNLDWRSVPNTNSLSIQAILPDDWVASSYTNLIPLQGGSYGAYLLLYANNQVIGYKSTHTNGEYAGVVDFACPAALQQGILDSAHGILLTAKYSGTNTTLQRASYTGALGTTCSACLKNFGFVWCADQSACMRGTAGGVYGGTCFNIAATSNQCVTTISITAVTPSAIPLLGVTTVFINLAQSLPSGPHVCAFRYGLNTIETPLTEITSLAHSCPSPGNPPTHISIAYLTLRSSTTGSAVTAAWSLVVYGISSMTPVNGPSDKGNEITLAGNFLDSTVLPSASYECRFTFLSPSAGPFVVPSTVTSFTTLRCNFTSVLPTPNFSTQMSVEVGLAGDGWEAAPTVYAFINKPSLAWISPVFAPHRSSSTNAVFSDGGSGLTTSYTTITLHGAHFLANQNLFFRADAGTGSVYLSIGVAESTTKAFVTLTSVPASPLVYNVTVSNNNIDYSDEVKTFTFIAPPIVSAVSPISGSSRGNLSITVTGSNFLPSNFQSEILASAVCYFGLNKGTITSISNNEIVCALPPGSGIVPVTISLNGIDRYTEYPTQVLYFSYLDTSNTEYCRGTAELDFGTTFRLFQNLDYFPNIFTQAGVYNFFNTSLIVATANPARLATETEAVAVTNNFPGGVVDGDRCCVPTAANQGRACGYNFKEDSSCVLDVDFSGGDVEAYVNELVVSWFDPCSNLPDKYDVFYWSSSNWIKLLSHDTSSDGLSPCLLTSSDSDNVAICFDFFAPILTTKFRVAFNNTGPQFDAANSRGGWIYEIEPHGVFVNQPVSQSLSFGTSASCVSTRCSLVSAETVSIPTITHQLLTILGTPATANNIKNGVTVNVSCEYLADADADAAEGTVCTFNGNASATITSTQGSHSFSDLSLTAPKIGVYLLSFKTDGMADQSVSLTITPGDPVLLRVDTNNLAVVVNSEDVLRTLLVTLYDAGGNVVNKTLPTTLDAQLFDSQNVELPLSGNTSLPVVEGSASFSDLSFDNGEVATHTLSIFYDTLQADVYITVKAGDPHAFSFVVEFPSAVTNLVVVDPQPVLQLTDSLGNPISDFGALNQVVQVQVMVTPTPLLLVGSVATADSAGLVTFTNLQITGIRGQEYTATFSPSAGPSLNLQSAAVTFEIAPCGDSQVNTAQGDSCECAPGYEQATAASETEIVTVCTVCKVGSFKPYAGLSLCTFCPANMVTLETGATHISQCLCKAGMFYDNATSACVDCLDGGTCLVGAELSSIEPQAGFYRFAESSSVFYPCHYAPACPGGNQTCATGYTGPLCGICEPGYGGDEACLICLESHWNWILVILLGVALLFTIAYTVYTTTLLEYKKTGVLKTMINYLQLLSFLGYFHMKWPSQITSAFNVVSISTLQVNFSPVTCLFGFDFYDLFIAYAALPWGGAIVASLLFIAIYFGYVLYKRHHKEPANQDQEEALELRTPNSVAYIEVTASGAAQAESQSRSMKKRFLDAYITTIVVIVFLSHPLVTKTALEMFHCESFDVGNGSSESYLAADYSIACSGGTYIGYTTASAIILAFFSLGAPLVSFISLFRHRNRLEAEGTQRRYRFLYQGFLDRAYYWEFVIMFRKVAIVALIVFSTNVQFQAFGALWLLIFCIGIHLIFRPFRYKAVDTLELLGLTAIFVTFLAGFTFYQNDEATAQGEPVLSTALVALLMAFVIILNTIVIIYGLLLIVIDRFFDRILTYCESSDNVLWKGMADWMHKGFADQDRVKSYREEQNIPQEIELYRQFTSVDRQKRTLSVKSGKDLREKYAIPEGNKDL